VGAETYASPTSTGIPPAPVPLARLANGTKTVPTNGTVPTANGTVPAPAAPAVGPASWITRSAEADNTAPRVTRPEPRLRQLMGVCGWAAVLGGIGLVIGIRGLFGVLAGDPPGWYEPTAIAAGASGIILTVGAFLTVHRARAPWIMLLASSMSLITAMVLTSYAF
jgi:hypothetical protein